MASVVDLTGLGIVDQHCHPVMRGEGRLTVEDFGSRFTESTDPLTRTQHSRTTLAYTRTIRELGRLLGTGEDEAATIAVRDGMDAGELLSLLFEDARIETLLVDTGYPPPPRLEIAEIASLGKVETHEILRLEPIFEQAATAASSLSECRELVREEVGSSRDRGVVALKSVTAYRGGLDIRLWSDDEVRSSFAAAAGRAEMTRLGADDRPLLDDLLRLSLRIAVELDLPVQLHTGFGDAEVDLRRATPLHLRGLLADGGADGVRLVLLHMSYPFMRDAAYLASLHDSIWLDVDFGVPFLSTAEQRNSVRELLGLAPLSKVAYSSDGFLIPELHWAAARSARVVLAEVLEEAVDDGDLSAGRAFEAGKAILSGTARSLYSV